MSDNDYNQLHILSGFPHSYVNMAPSILRARKKKQMTRFSIMNNGIYCLLRRLFVCKCIQLCSVDLHALRATDTVITTIAGIF